MRIEAKVIPVDGITKVPGLIEGAEDAQSRQERAELLLLNVATGLAVALVSCAWIAIAIE